MVNKSDRQWELARPIRARPGEHFNHEDRELYDVALAVALINRQPEDYEFLVLPIEMFREQIVGRGHVDFGYLDTLTNEDAVRPLLIGRYADGSVRMLDGYHRASWLLRAGVNVVGAWVLTAEQTNKIRVHLPPELIPKNARVTPSG